MQNIWIMAYDHSVDLPENYNYAAMYSRLSNPGRLDSIHGAVEGSSFLNLLGHASIQNALGRVYPPADLLLANFGVTLYEAGTAVQFIDGDEAGTPTYTDPVGAAVAAETAFQLEQLNEFDIPGATNTAVGMLERTAPNLTSFLRFVSFDVLDKPVSDEKVRRVLDGAALIRALSNDAAVRLKDAA